MVMVFFPLTAHIIYVCIYKHIMVYSMNQYYECDSTTHQVLRIILPLPIQDDLSLLVAKDYSVNKRYVFA